MALRIPVGQDDHVQGPATALITLLEYGDYECPYCGAAYPLVKQLRREFGSRMRFVFRNFPLAQVHAQAVNAAMTAEYGATHRRFWEVHDALYENQVRLGQALYREILEGLDLDPVAWKSALSSNVYAERIQQEFEGGVRSGVNGTPSFFINGRRYNGPIELEAMIAALEHG